MNNLPNFGRIDNWNNWEMVLSDQSTTPLAFESLTTQAFDRLETAITTGELEPGAKISEADLARRFGISRGPLREAIARLEGRRLVERLPNVGARVTVLKPKDLFELYSIREALEGMACRLAATTMVEKDIANLNQILDIHAEEPDVKDGIAYYQKKGEQDFHFYIARCSGNDWLFDLLCRDLYSILRLYRFKFSATRGRPQQALSEHREIVKSLMSGDPERSEQTMRQHIRNSLQNIKRQLSSDD